MNSNDDAPYSHTFMPMRVTGIRILDEGSKRKQKQIRNLMVPKNFRKTDNSYNSISNINMFEIQKYRCVMSCTHHRKLGNTALQVKIISRPLGFNPLHSDGVSCEAEWDHFGGASNFPIRANDNSNSDDTDVLQIKLQIVYLDDTICSELGECTVPLSNWDKEGHDVDVPVKSIVSPSSSPAKSLRKGKNQKLLLRKFILDDNASLQAKIYLAGQETNELPTPSRKDGKNSSERFRMRLNKISKKATSTITNTEYNHDQPDDSDPIASNDRGWVQVDCSDDEKSVQKDDNNHASVTIIGTLMDALLNINPCASHCKEPQVE